MLRRQLLVTVSSLALTGIASAADLPARMPVKAPPPAMIVQSWAGPYIGVNGGAVWHRLKTDTTLDGFGPWDSATVKGTGATFGGQIGYNWQSQNFVYGLEADLNWVGVKDSHQQLGGFGGGFPVVHTTNLSWLATVRARGGTVFGPNLLYVTGGLAVGNVKNTWSFPPPVTCGGGVCPEAIRRDTRFGWTAGGGIERFISQNVTAKAEVLYVDLGRKSLNGAITTDYTSRFKNTAVVGRLGVNLKW
jgi:outer membrane immunogenic protein